MVDCVITNIYERLKYLIFSQNPFCVKDKP